MSHYTISEDQGFIRVIYIGQTSYDVSTKMMRDLAAVAARTGLNIVLVDIRRAQGSGSHSLPIQHVEEAPRLGISPEFRSALLGSPENEAMLEYIENVSVNRGMQVRAFIDEDDALSWLLGED